MWYFIVISRVRVCIDLGKDGLAVLLTTVRSNWLRFSVLFPFSSKVTHFSTRVSKTPCRFAEHFASQPPEKVASLSSNKQSEFALSVWGNISKIFITI